MKTENKTEISNFSNTVKVKGVDVHYEYYSTEANKPAVVLIHGFLSSTFSYRRLIPFLKDDYTVLAVDLPPFGKSEKSSSFVYSYSNLASVVVELINKLSLKEVVLVGHSMGGQICLNIVRQQPGLVRKVVLLCSSGYLNRSPKPLIYSTYLPYFSLVVKRWLAKQGIMKNLMNVVNDHALIDDEMVDGYMEPFLDNQIFRALARLIRHREGDLLPEQLQEIEVPILLLWGEDDRVVPLSIGKRLQADLRNSELMAISNTGHLLPEERPEYVYDKMRNFILRQPSF